MAKGNGHSVGPHWVDVYVGRRVRAERKRQGLSQEKLADACGITFQQIQKYEKGTNRISCSRLVEIAAALGLSPTKLLPAETGQPPAEEVDPAPPVRRLQEALRAAQAAAKEVARAVG